MKVKPQIGAQLNRGNPLSKGLLGYYAMNEGGGGTLNDLSGRGNDAALANVDPDADWRAGENGHSLFLDRTGLTGAYIPTGIMLGEAEEFSIVILGVTDYFDGNEFFADTSNGSTGFGWRVQAGTQDFFCYRQSGGISFVSNFPYVDNEYALRVVAMEKSRIVAYIDGVEVGSNSDSTGPLVSSASAINIGAAFNGGENLESRLSMAAVYNRALSAKEVSDLYFDPFAPIRAARPFIFAPAAAGKMLMRHPGMTGGMQELLGGAAA